LRHPLPPRPDEVYPSIELDKQTQIQAINHMAMSHFVGLIIPRDGVRIEKDDDPERQESSDRINDHIHRLKDPGQVVSEEPKVNSTLSPAESLQQLR
jgi:hypothetical protein